MPVNRADYGIIPHPPKYIDVSLDFDLEPESGEVGIVTDEAAIVQFLRCLLLTNEGEWAFEPNNGTRISRQLFGLNDTAAIIAMTEVIKIALRQKAPMVQLIDLKVHRNRDESGVIIELFWRMSNLPDRINSTAINLNPQQVLTQIG